MADLDDYLLGMHGCHSDMTVFDLRVFPLANPCCHHFGCIVTIKNITKTNLGQDHQQCNDTSYYIPCIYTNFHPKLVLLRY